MRFKDGFHQLDLNYNRNLGSGCRRFRRREDHACADDKGERNGSGVVSVSARVLAGGIWRLQLAAAAAAEVGFVAGGRFHWTGREPRNLYRRIPFRFTNSIETTMEGAIKSNIRHSTLANEINWFSTRFRLLADQPVSALLIVSALQAKLVRTEARIQRLEAQRHSSNDKPKCFLGELGLKERDKARIVVEGLKNSLDKERRYSRGIEVVNSKLAKELAYAKSSTKRYMQSCRKEREGKELMENVRKYRTKEIEENKAAIKSLERELMEIRERVERKRMIMQMNEVWHEERVHMKLMDAKLVLEEKYSQMNRIIDDIKAFIHRRSSIRNVMEAKEAEIIDRLMSSVNTNEMKIPGHLMDISELSGSLQDTVKLFTRRQPSNSSPVHINDSKSISSVENPCSSHIGWCNDAIHSSLSFDITEIQSGKDITMESKIWGLNSSHLESREMISHGGNGRVLMKPVSKLDSVSSDRTLGNRDLFRNPSLVQGKKRCIIWPSSTQINRVKLHSNMKSNNGHYAA